MATRNTRFYDGGAAGGGLNGLGGGGGLRKESGGRNGSVVSRGSTTGKSVGKGAAFGYTLMKCQDVLKSTERPLHTHELQQSIGGDCAISQDTEFLTLLKDTPNIVFNPATKRWSYSSPFEAIRSPAGVITALRERSECANGLEVTPELLSHNNLMEDWIKELLRTRQVRAIRATRNVRCKNYTAESGIQCDMYEGDKCDTCNTLKGVMLYQLEEDYLENVHVDEDIKSMWLELPMPSLDEILDECNLSRHRNMTGDGSRKRRRKPGSSGRGRGRVSKIANTHIYSLDDFKQEVADANEAETSSCDVSSSLTTTSMYPSGMNTSKW